MRLGEEYLFGVGMGETGPRSKSRKHKQAGKDLPKENEMAKWLKMNLGSEENFFF